jgi:hypothetical protein
MIVLFIILLSPSHFVMPHCSCFLHCSRRCFRQNLEPGLRRVKTKPELEYTTENCYSTHQTMYCLL